MNYATNTAKAEQTTKITKSMLLLLFNEAESGIICAENALADMFAPNSFNKAVHLYNKADSLFELNAEYNVIQKKLEESISKSEFSIQTTYRVLHVLTPALSSRVDAEKVNAGQYAKNDWDAAELKFALAANKLEEGKMTVGQNYANEAETLYRKAESESIQKFYIPETKKLVTKAEKLKAKKLAPITLGNAKDLLKNTEIEQKTGLRDPDMLKNPALAAYSEANHALYLTKKIKQLKDAKTSYEKMQFSVENIVQLMAIGLDLEFDLDQDMEGVALDMMEYFIAYQDSVEYLVSNYILNQQLLLLQRAYIVHLEEIAGEAITQVADSKSKLMKQQQLVENFTTIIQLFNQEEAEIFLLSNNVVIRLIGLQFKSGSSDIATEYQGLLKKVAQVFNLYQQSYFTIEGNTDSNGDDVENIKLSKNRADAVKKYITDLSKIDANQITTLGYGETKPIAFNLTKEGRARNRRIEIIIHN